MSDIASVEADLKQYQEQLDVVNAGLKDDAGNEELLALKAELNEFIGLLNETLAELKPSKAAAAPPGPPATRQQPPQKQQQQQPAAEQEKWSRENHPAFKKTAPVTEDTANDVPAVPVNYRVNDNVMAKWVTGDRAFYAARITSITGSSTDPIYIVKFKSYDQSEQLRARDIKPMTGQKRKADDPPTANGSATTASASTSAHAASASAASSSGTATSSQPFTSTGSSSNSGVISAAANINLELAQKSREGLLGAPEAKPKAKKIRATKELETGKNKWQEFNTKSKFAKASKGKKDSMFRTPEGVHGRVGFTGSGQAMRKDPTRSRHIYQAAEDLD